MFSLFGSQISFLCCLNETIEDTRIQELAEGLNDKSIER
jgi:hypothetical protein